MRTILYCSHLLDVVERVCTRIIVLARGEIRLDGSLTDIQRQYPGRSLEVIFQELTGTRALTSAEAAMEADPR